MGVSVDPPGYDHPARGVNDPGAPRNLQIKANLFDDLVLDVDVRSLASILIDDHSPLDEDPEKRNIIKMLTSSLRPPVL